MERFKKGQKVRILTVDELLKKGYDIYADDYINCEEDCFVIDDMGLFSNEEIIITSKNEMEQFFILDGWSFYPDMCEPVEDNKVIRGFEIVNEEFRKHPNVDIQLPIRGDSRSAGYDIRTPIRIELQPNERVLVFTDIKACMLPDEVLEIHVRSSIGVKKNIVLSNITGIIDSSYYGNPSNDGNIGLTLWNTSDKVQVLEANERVCQGIFKKYLVASNDNIVNNERTGGFGSTGAK